MPKRVPPIPEGCDATIRTAVLQHLMRRNPAAFIGVGDRAARDEQKNEWANC